MQILSLDLENIKSYSRAAIGFTGGMNAVCGLNGSGKTTVLEAIGFALFSYLPYSQTAFLREGQKTGTIRVRLLADDDRQYEVVRKIGASGVFYVADVETGMRIAERELNVLDWVRTQVLGIDGEVDLKALFKNAVGVPQGTMTAAFLESAVTRKAIFDPLLRVAEYREAYENLRETVSYLKDLSSTVGQEMARLEGDVEKIPETNARVAELLGARRASEERLAALAADLVEIDVQLKVLDGIAEALLALQQQMRDAQYDADRHRDALRLHRQRLEAARTAREAMREAEPGHHAYLGAQAQLAQLEERRRRRDDLQAEKAKASAAMNGIYGRIETLDQQRREAVTASDSAAALSERVERQTILEREHQEARLQLRDLQALDGQRRKIDADVQKLEHTLAERERSLAGVRDAQGEAEHLPDLEEAVRATQARLAELKPLQRQLEEVGQEGQRRRKQCDALRADVERLNRLREQIGGKRAEAESLEVLLTRQGELRDESARVSTTIELRSLARVDLERQHCPLLDLQCPVVTADAGALDRLIEDVDAMQTRATELQLTTAALETEIAAARVAATELQELQIAAGRLERSEKDLVEIEAQVERYRERYADLQRTMAEAPELRRSEQRLLGEVRRLQAAARLAAQLQPLEEQQERDRETLDRLRGELERLEGERAPLANLAERAADLERELRELGDARSEQQGLLATAGRRVQIEEQIEVEQRALDRESDKLKALVAGLQEFESLERDLEEQRGVEAASRAAYERYLHSESEAGQVEERERLVAESANALTAAEDRVAELTGRLEETQQRYDEERHVALRARHTGLGEEMAAETATHGHVAADLAREEEALAYLRRQEQKLLERRTEWDDLERSIRALSFVRETIKAAGPAVTESLLGTISQIANDIYCEVMDDHAPELRWDSEYEVLVQQGSETRKFVQLSGGEQMSAALSVRLALLKEMSEVDVAFFDEPTQNMDGERRGNLADQIRQVRGFNQLIVISHDDTFEQHTDNLIRLLKVDGETLLDAG